MDFAPYVENIIDKLKDDGCYFEMSEADLRKSIHQYLKKEYRAKIDMAAFDYEIAEANHDSKSNEELENIFIDIKNEMITIIRELAKTKL